MFDQLSLRIRRREGGLYRFLYNLAHALQRLNVPDFLLPAYSILYGLRRLALGCWNRGITVFILAPMFRSQCRKVGKSFNYVKLQQGFPYMSGPIQVYFGDNVTFHSRSTLAASKVFDAPVFRVGDRTFLGGGLAIGVAREVSIGSNCLIA